MRRSTIALFAIHFAQSESFHPATETVVSKLPLAGDHPMHHFIVSPGQPTSSRSRCRVVEFATRAKIAMMKSPIIRSKCGQSRNGLITLDQVQASVNRIASGLHIRVAKWSILRRF
jgi:hypothetical protein